MAFDLDETGVLAASAAESNGHEPARPDVVAELRRLAEECAECRVGIREWMLAIFHHRAEPDQEAERVWKAKATAMVARAEERLATAEPSKERSQLESANAALRWLLDGWLSPKPGVGIGARLGMRNLSPEAAQAAIRRMAELPHRPW